MIAQILADKLSKILQDFPEISLVYLFGSRVSGEIGPMSDYDFGIFEDSQDRFSTQAKFQHVLQQFLQPAKVDVVLLMQAPIELTYHVIANGLDFRVRQKSRSKIAP
jgi:predicted nucleotidyltransferase